jgi:hypothetical protein
MRSLDLLQPVVVLVEDLLGRERSFDSREAFFQGTPMSHSM